MNLSNESHGGLTTIAEKLTVSSRPRSPKADEVGTVRCDWIASDEDGTGNGALRRHLPDGFRATAEAS
jgi:predicted transcriptional regulator